MILEDIKLLLKIKSEKQQVDDTKIQTVLKLHTEINQFVDNLFIDNKKLCTFQNIIENIDAPLYKVYQLEKLPWLKSKCVVGVMGRYSTGKTTLMNSLLGLNLPTDSEANTPIPTYIAHGSKTELMVLTCNNDVKRLPIDMLKMFDHVYSDDFPFSEIIQYMVLYQNSKLLKSISFLDTPGFSRDLKDLNKSANVTQQCDIFLWLIRTIDGQFDANYEIPFIKKYLSNSKIYIVLTFIDRCDDVDSVKDVIKKTLKKEKISYEDILLFTNYGNEQQVCIDNISSILIKESNSFSYSQPIVDVEKYLNEVLNSITSKLNALTKEKNSLEKKGSKYLNKVTDALDSFTNSCKKCSEEFKSYIETVQNTCLQGWFWCGESKYEKIRKYLNVFQKKYDTMISDFQEVNVDDIKEYGRMDMSLAFLRAQIDIQTINRNKCVDLINQLNKL